MANKQIISKQILTGCLFAILLVAAQLLCEMACSMLLFALLLVMSGFFLRFVFQLLAMRPLLLVGQRGI